MKLSTKGRYGLRAMVDLAVNSQKEPVSVHSIAQRQGISDRYLEQLIAMLKKAGLIDSVRGVQGGYRLAKDPKDISAGDILRVLEGDLKPVDCAALEEDRLCESADSCVTKYVWKKIHEGIETAVDSISLYELMQLQWNMMKEEKG